jgi:predicted lipoprotein with Yx(FWY)xxD motif
VLGVAVFLPLVAAGCSGDDGAAPATTTESGPGATAAPDRSPELTAVPGTTAPPRPTRVTAAPSALGPILVDGDGRTLYVLLTGSCTDVCLDAWPPLTSPPDPGPEAGPALDAAALAVGPAPGGLQVSYGGRPLHRFGGDVEPAEVTGQGVNGVWFVVSPSGDPITTSLRD